LARSCSACWRAVDTLRTDTVADAMFCLCASIGIVEIEDDDPRDAGQILCDADTAMYHAKLSGEGISCYYAEALRQQTA
jgi:GGDEF domain-containing protein